MVPGCGDLNASFNVLYLVPFRVTMKGITTLGVIECEGVGPAKVCRMTQTGLGLGCDDHWSGSTPKVGWDPTYIIGLWVLRNVRWV